MTAGALKLLKLAGIEVIEPGDSRLLPYTTDATGNGVAPFAILPATAGELVTAVQILVRHKVPVTVRGSGTSTAGASLPDGTALIYTGRLNNIIIHEEDMLAEVEPGALLGEIKDAAAVYGLSYPPDPASFAYATIGGTIATNAGGPSTYRWGVTRDYLRKIEFVDGRGTLLSFGAATHKYATAYFLPPLFCGSEGTLGVLTKAWLKLVPLPSHTYYYELDNVPIEDLTLIRKQYPVTIEYLDARARELVTGVSEPLILLNIEAMSQEELDAARSRFEALGNLRGWGFRGGSKKKDIWRVRENLSPLSYKLGDHKVSQDVAVPLAQAQELFDFIALLRQSARIQHCELYAFGHLGDGNIHINIMTHKEHAAAAQNLQEQIMIKVKQLGGIISGEHGIGYTRKHYLADFIKPEELALMRNIKALFDPDNLMNPRVMFS